MENNTNEIENIDYCYLDADDICYCKHRRDVHDYSKETCLSSYLPNHNCSQCDCRSWNMSVNTEYVLDWKRLYWKLFKGYRTPKIKCYFKKLEPFTKFEIEQIKKEFCVK